MTPAPALVLDGWTTQALACVRSLGRLGHPVLVASDRRFPVAAWSRYARATYRLAGETPAAFRSLRAWALTQGARMVFPMTERACVLCNLERDAWEAAGMVLGCAPQGLLLQAFDKVLTLEAAQACEVNTPPTRLPGSLAEAKTAAAELGYPCVVKARSSNAWDGTKFLPNLAPAYARDTAEIESAVQTRRQGVTWPMIQGLVRGQGKGVFALFDHGRAVAWFAHERLRDVRPSGSGSSLRRSAPLEPRLLEPAERLLTALRWHGPAMVEFRDDGVHPPYLMEVNGRFWGSLQLAVAAGADFPAWWAAILSGRPVERRTSYATGVTVRWLWGDIKRFLYILSGAPSGYPGRYPTILQGLRELLGAQPAGTQSESWQSDDRWPAVGELVQGIGEILSLVWRNKTPPPAEALHHPRGGTAGPAPTDGPQGQATGIESPPAAVVTGKP